MAAASIATVMMYTEPTPLFISLTMESVSCEATWWALPCPSRRQKRRHFVWFRRWRICACVRVPIFQSEITKTSFFFSSAGALCVWIS